MPDSGLINSKIHLYSGQVKNFTNIKLQASEKIVGYKLCSLPILKQTINDNTIVDGYTLALIAKLMCHGYTESKISDNVNLIDAF